MGEPTAEPEQPATEIVESERRRSRRSVGFILGVVGVTIALLVGLGIWVALSPRVPSATLGATEVRCDTIVDAVPPAPDVDAWVEACADAEDPMNRRRDVAVVIGAVAVVIAWAVSTWPSRRLTGERLGPLRPPAGDDPGS